MAHIRYKGRSDARILDARDLKSLGVEDFRKTTFLRNQPTEVTDEVAQALTSTKALAREFEVVDEESAEDTDEEADGPSILTQKETAKQVAGSGGSSGGGGTARTASTSATGTGGATGGTRRGGRGASTSGAS